MHNPLQNQRLAYLDFLKCLAAICVVTIHATADLVVNRAHGNKSLWAEALTLNSFSRWAVPVFIMASGAVLLMKYSSVQESDMATFYNKRLSKTFILIAVWTAVYTLWRVFMYDQPFSLDGLWHDLQYGNTFLHLYFLFLIAGLYFVTPYIAYILKALTRRQSIRLTLALIATASAWHAIYFFNNNQTSPQLNIFGQWIPYIGYFVAGFTIVKYRYINSPVAIILFVAGCIGQLLLAYLSVAKWNGLAYYFDYLTIPTIFQSIGLFALVSLHYDRIVKKSRFNTLSAFVRKFAPLTLGVYLIHIIVMDIGKILLQGERIPATSMVNLTLLIIFTVVVSSLLVIGLGRISLAKKYIIPQ